MVDGHNLGRGRADGSSQHAVQRVSKVLAGSHDQAQQRVVVVRACNGGIEPKHGDLLRRRNCVSTRRLLDQQEAWEGKAITQG